jgi:ATP-dependent Lon protease
MIRVGEAFDMSEMGASMLRKRSLEAIGAHQLFDALKIEQLSQGVNDETKIQLSKLNKSGPLRRFAPVPVDYVERSRKLEAQFPNFAEFIDDVLLPSLALAHVRGSGLQLHPTVFCGSPGVGKTMFAQALADAFDLDFERLNLEAAQGSLDLIGTSRGWSNAQPGVLFRWLAGNECANGVFVLEELDKANSGDARFPIMNALLQLLEPTTARVFSDQSLPELKLDITKLNFLFTANTLEAIPEPLLSRLVVFDVPSLTPVQAKSVALRQYEDMLKELKLPLDAPILTEEGLRVLSMESPRRQRLLLQMAIGSAVFKKASELQIKSKPRVQRGMGFTASFGG